MSYQNNISNSANTITTHSSSTPNQEGNLQGRSIVPFSAREATEFKTSGILSHIARFLPTTVESFFGVFHLLPRIGNANTTPRESQKVERSNANVLALAYLREPERQINHFLEQAPGMTLQEKCAALSNEKLEFLLANGHKVFNLDGDWSSVDLDMLITLFPNITSISFECSNINNTHLPALSIFTKLKRISFHGCNKITDLTHLNLSSQLLHLDLSYCKGITDFTPLSRYSCLERLNLSGCGKIRDLTTLPPSLCSSLRHIDLSGCVQLRDLTGLQAFTQLKRLNLSKCKKITTLNALRACTELQYLRLNDCTQIVDLTALTACTKLKHVELDRCSQITDLTPLGACTELEYLKLNDCTGIADLSLLNRYPKLRHIELDGCTQITDLTPLTRCIALQYLTLENCTGITNLLLLNGCTKLKHLNLHGCTQITDLKPLEACTQLQHVTLDECTGITDLSPLKRCTKLKQLDLCECDQITIEQKQELQRCLPNQLESLQIEKILADLLSSYDRLISYSDYSSVDKKRVGLFLAQVSRDKIATFPEHFQNELRLRRMNGLIEELSLLKNAYRSRNLTAILESERENTRIDFKFIASLAIQYTRDPELHEAYEYYNKMRQECATCDLCQPSLRIEECKDYLTILSKSKLSSQRLDQKIAFLKIRIAFETKNLQDLFDFELKDNSASAMVGRLSPQYRSFLEGRYDLSDGFWHISHEFINLYNHYAKHKTPMQQNINNIEKYMIIYIYNCIKRLFSYSRIHQGSYDTYSDQLFQYVSPEIGSFITDFNRLLSYKLCMDTLSALLGALQHLSPELQNQWTTECRDIIEKMEAIPLGTIASALLPILQRQATMTIEAALIQYKKAAERLQDGSLNDTERTYIIWNLAHIGDVMDPAELARVKTALSTLYPHLFASLQTITYELLYTKFLMRLRPGDHVMSVDGILTVQGIAMHLSANQCEDLLTKLRQHISDFDTRIPNVSELYPIIRTDMGALRQICQLQNTSLTLTERAATVEHIDAYRKNMKPAHFTALIQTLTQVVRGNPIAKNLLKAIHEATLELACRGLTSQDTSIKNRSIVEIGEIFAKQTIISMTMRREFSEYLKTNYPAFGEYEVQILCVGVNTQYTHFKQRNETPNAECILQLDTLVTQMNPEQCSALLRDYYPDINTSFPMIDYFSYLFTLHCFDALSATPEDRERMRLLNKYPNVNEYGTAIQDAHEVIAASPAGRQLLRKFCAYHLESMYERLAATTVNKAEQNGIIDEMSAILVMNRQLHMMLRDMHVLDNEILDNTALTTLSQRYPSTIQQEELECMTSLSLLQQYKTEKQNASPEEYIQLQTREREVCTTLSSVAARMGGERYSSWLARIQTYKPTMRNLITAIQTEDFIYNMSYRLSPNHYDRVRFDDVIPPLPASIIDQDGAFRDGLINFFTALPLAELQAQLTTPRENARETLSTYINNVITHAPLTGAPNPTNQPEEAKAFWLKIKQTIMHILIHFNDAEQKATELVHDTDEAKKARDQALETLKKKKIQFLAALIDSVDMCGGRYKADAVDLYQQIVTNRPVSFETVIFRELNNMREANARVLSLTGVENAGDEPHEFMGFLRLVGHALAIRGTPKAEERFDDIYFSGTRINREYANNTQRLRQRFEETYTPFNIITCIQQEVGPGANVDNRNLFRDWCLTNVPVSVYWGGASGSRDLSDWGMYHDDITSIDTARRQLRDQRSRSDIIDPLAEQAVLRTHSIAMQPHQGIDASVDAHEAKIKKEAYLAREGYEAYPNDMRVKRAFIAKILVQMGIISSHS